MSGHCVEEFAEKTLLNFKQFVPQFYDIDSSERLTFKNDLVNALRRTQKIICNVHPSNLSVGCANYQHDGVSVSLPVSRMAFILNRKYLLTISCAGLQIGVARFQL